MKQKSGILFLPFYTFSASLNKILSKEMVKDVNGLRPLAGAETNSFGSGTSASETRMIRRRMEILGRVRDLKKPEADGGK
jgi:hypothetical protein